MREHHYPTHTLAPDPLQPELMLVPQRPPDRNPCLPIRASPVFTSCCPVCGGVHGTKADYRICVSEHDRQR